MAYFAPHGAMPPAAGPVRTRSGALSEQMYGMPVAPPPPLTAELLSQAMVELGPGSAHAVKACYDCYTTRSMSAVDLISFVKSISPQSATLLRVFASPHLVQSQPANEVASMEDFAFLMQAYGNAPAPPPPTAMRHAAHRPTSRAAAVAAPVPAPVQRVQLKMEVQEAVTAPYRPAPRVRRSTHSEPSPEENRLMLWWSDRRVPEVERRQRETVDNAHISARSTASALLMYKFKELSAALTTAGKVVLLAVVRGANSGRMSDTAVAEGMQKLVVHPEP
ncbi:hypothetical protein T484DRAFT_3075669 [Baffinella frigidus]|nr:hypothetical protein T484DRAFT_3075669 [Cryptophyta sp. CCMP2293]